MSLPPLSPPPPLPLTLWLSVCFRLFVSYMLSSPIITQHLLSSFCLFLSRFLFFLTFLCFYVSSSLLSCLSHFIFFFFSLIYCLLFDFPIFISPYSCFYTCQILFFLLVFLSFQYILFSYFFIHFPFFPSLLSLSFLSFLLFYVSKQFVDVLHKIKRCF